ncbi:hypothetical protein PENTCL1PPCAC_20593 [Pristionchus entomophagus]|uniref:Uncharacterized protein n=1 Tax=Pristionchus entomophagus TaxID=358040 RepID=A0AAV5TWM2_9BILA|nr:hypothetical protein PENTCL1PPCAC_20593 [Pristionchus entomophagus]
MDKPENSDDSIEDRAEDQDEDEPVRHQQSDDEIAAAQLAQMRISAKTLDSKDKEEKPKSDVDQDGKITERSLTWNMGRFFGEGSTNITRFRELKERVEDYKPVLLKLNEIWGTTKSNFIKFAKDLGYDVLSLTYTDQEGRMRRAAAILVQNDCNTDYKPNELRFKKTIEITIDNNYSIAGVHDRENDTHHVCVYIHHNEKVEGEEEEENGEKEEKEGEKKEGIEEEKKEGEKKEEKDEEKKSQKDKGKKKTEKENESISLMRKFGAAIDTIKENIRYYFDSIDESLRRNMITDLKFLRIIISGDLNCVIAEVETVCREKERDFISLQDQLHPKWHTRVVHYKNSKTTYTKIDYILACNVFLQVHKPIEMPYDHFIIIEDLYHHDHNMINSYCSKGDLCVRFKCKVPEIIVDDPEVAALELLVDIYNNAAPDNILRPIDPLDCKDKKCASKKCVHSVWSHWEYYKSAWKDQVCNFFCARITKGRRYNQKSLPNFLDHLMFGELRLKEHVSKSDENKINWICATVTRLQQKNINDKLDSTSVNAEVKDIKSQLSKGRLSARGTPLNSPSVKEGTPSSPGPSTSGAATSSTLTPCRPKTK